jgi:hypothetical protein
MLTISEQSRQKFAISFKDEDYEPFVPSTVRYRLDDKTDDITTVILDWQTVATPDSRIEILIPSSANAILNDLNAYETRVLTIQSDYGTDNQLTEDETYRIRNLQGFQ